MNRSATKERLLASLPVRRGNLTIRPWTRGDVDTLASWPDYPFPYETFRLSFAGMTPREKDEAFLRRQEAMTLIVLVVDDGTRPAIGYIAPTRIDWSTGTVGNFGFRVHPECCDEGIGTAVLQTATEWSFKQGIKSWRLDVAASNARAIRCYEKVGFLRTGEMWREARDLNEVDLDAPRYDFIRAHVRKTDGKIELRFCLMELNAETQAASAR